MSDKTHAPDQPAASGGEGDVWAEIIGCLPAGDPFRAVLEERRALGIAKHGQPLRRGDGRDHAIDEAQELMDAAAYRTSRLGRPGRQVWAYLQIVAELLEIPYTPPLSAVLPEMSSEYEDRTRKAWNTEYQQQTPQPRYTEAFARMVYVWLDYYVQCEDYDRLFPGKWSEHDSELWLPHDEARCGSNAVYMSQKAFALTGKGVEADRARGIAADLRYSQKRAMMEQLVREFGETVRSRL